MGECNSIGHDFHNIFMIFMIFMVCIQSANISHEQQLRLNKFNEIKDYFLPEIREISKNEQKF